MNIQDIVIRNPEVVKTIEENIERLKGRASKGAEYLDSCAEADRDKSIIMYTVEILQPLNRYIEILKGVGVEVTETEDGT